jgi:hypothetical protein
MRFAFKTLAIFGLTIAILLALSLIRGTVQDRQRYRAEAVEEARHLHRRTGDDRQVWPAGQVGQVPQAPQTADLALPGMDGPDGAAIGGPFLVKGPVAGQVVGQIASQQPV